jgi:alpha-tubulin suppressor-like RCC1 family protein
MKAFAVVATMGAVVALTVTGAAMPRTSVTSAGAVSVPSAIVVGNAGPYTDGCVVFSGGTIECWGYNGYGQLGTGSIPTQARVFRSTPVAVKRISSAKAVGTGGNTTCALLSGGTVKCWGANGLGQLGNGTTTTYSLRPVAVKGISSAKAISTGATNTTCVLLSGGAIDCWGNNVYGQLGNGKTGGYSPRPVAVKGLSGAKAVSTGGDHTCALLSGGAIDCWGNNSEGQLGDGPTATNGGYGSSLLDSSTPVAVKGISSAIAVSVGLQDSCAVLSGGSVECWGANLYGQLGNGTTGGTGSASVGTTPVAVKGIGSAKAVSTGLNGACAVLLGGTIRCWGANNGGSLGNGTSKGSSTPVPVKGISSAKAVSTDGNVSCALLSGGSVKCWGAGSGGQLGDGANTNHSTPVAVRLTTPTQPTSRTYARFYTPSRNIACEMSDHGTAPAGIGCIMQKPPALASLKASGVATICQHQGLKCTGNLGDDPRLPPPRKLPYGSRVTVGRFRCASASKGVACVVIATGKGFFISRQSVSTVG